MGDRISSYISKNIKCSFTNKNVLITGGNSGLGFELAKHFCLLGANIYLLIRNTEKGEQAKDVLLKEFPKANINLLQLDLASFDSIQKCVKEIKKIDVDAFINNAGVFRLPKGTTKDGFEIIMGTNYLGTQYLNDLLMPYFKSLPHPVKILFTTSITSRMTKLNLNDFFSNKNYKNLSVYGRSKVAINNMYFNYVDECQNSNIILSLSHPGGTYTPLIKKGFRNKVFQPIAKGFMKLAFHSPRKASLCDLYALSKDENIIVGPRGIAEISGYPKITKFKKNSNYIQSVELGRKFISEVANK